MHGPAFQQRSEASPTFLIEDEPSLERFQRHIASSLFPATYQRIRVDLPSLEHRERFERRINFNYRACGCLEGGVAAVLTLVTLLGWHCGPAAGRPAGWADLASGFGWMVLAALFGKASGIVRARLSLRRAIQVMTSTLAAQARQENLHESVS